MKVESEEDEKRMKESRQNKGGKSLWNYLHDFFFFFLSFVPLIFISFLETRRGNRVLPIPGVPSNQSNLFAKVVDSQMVIVVYSGKPKHPPPSNLIVQFRRFDGGISRNFFRLEEIIISIIHFFFVKLINCAYILNFYRDSINIGNLTEREKYL